jgi:hypothetical protein
MNDGYIKISRKILGWEWYKDINTFRLFMHILLKAEWKVTEYKGERIERGACVSSLVELSEETKMSISEVRTALKHLETTGEIVRRPCAKSKKSVYKINNYDKYQTEYKQENWKSSAMDVTTYQDDRKKKNRRRFNNFAGRKYDMDSLTIGILQAQETGGKNGRSN